MNDLCVALLCLLATTPSQADEVFAGYGVGVFHDADNYTGQMKIAEIGFRHFVFEGVYWQNKIGYWGEGSDDKTRKNSGYYMTGLGMELDLRPFEMRSGYGVGLITTPDSQLGARFPQFNGELYVGLRDKKGDGIGARYNHFSCASLCDPNHGRDAVIIELSTKW